MTTVFKTSTVSSYSAQGRSQKFVLGRYKISVLIFSQHVIRTIPVAISVTIVSLFGISKLEMEYFQ